MVRRFALALAVVLASASLAAGVPLVELKTAGGAYRGRVVAKDAATALLVDRDGAMSPVPLAEVTSFGVAEPAFRPYDSHDLRLKLKPLVGQGGEILATRHFVVAGRPEAARAAAAALEEVHDQYRWFCSRHNLPLSNPEFALVALVLPGQESFRRHCEADGMPFRPGLAGYYLETSNRFVCYEAGATADDPIAGVRETLVHEAVHQLAFNTGLHTRLGSHPTWVIEGLATTLEPEGARRPFRSGAQTLDRVNPERFARFLSMAGAEGHVRLVDVVGEDEPFRYAPLESYAKAWAMTFYLLENRPGDYLKYLRKLAARPPLGEYPPEERMADFLEAFGRDPRRLEREIAQSMRRIAAGEAK